MKNALRRFNAAKVQRTVVWLTILTTVCPPAAAWGPEGHVVVGRIAELNLTPKCRAAVAELLDNRSLSDIRVVNWADYIKSSANYDRKYRNHRTWHYIDIELDANRNDFQPEMHVRGQPANNVVARIDYFRRVMVDPAVSRVDRKEALFFVAHFVGDFHQPLHCCHRDNDQGGNLQKIASFDGEAEEKLNLHWVWDGKLVQQELGAMLPVDYAARIESQISEQDRKQWQRGDIRDWAWDTHEVAVERVYRFADSGKFLPPRTDPPIALTRENYIDANLPTVRRQFQKAGIRLAKTLNDAFDPSNGEP